MQWSSQVDEFVPNCLNDFDHCEGLTFWDRILARLQLRSCLRLVCLCGFTLFRISSLPLLLVSFRIPALFCLRAERDEVTFAIEVLEQLPELPVADEVPHILVFQIIRNGGAAGQVQQGFIDETTS